MRLIRTKYQAEFRAAPETVYPGVGWIRQAGGPDSGNFTFVKIKEAGHSTYFFDFRSSALTYTSSGNQLSTRAAAASDGTVVEERALRLTLRSLYIINGLNTQLKEGSNLFFCGLVRAFAKILRLHVSSWMKGYVSYS